ncbi:TPA: recombinase family protein [Bacillus toyonensis]
MLCSPKTKNELNSHRQLMKQLITDERDIFVDKQGGRDFNREQYQLLKRMLRKDDILYIHSLDRFGRNKEAVLQELKDITQNIQAHIVVLDMPLLDTTQYKDSLGTLITDLVLQILSWLAEEERTKIKTRQREGIEAAKKRGKHLGRPKAEITQEFIDTYNDWKQGKITALYAMKKCNMTSPTFYRVVKRYEDKE